MLLLEVQTLNLNNPAFPILISCLAIFVTVYFHDKKARREIRKENDIKFKHKADMSYVKEKNEEMDEKINVLHRINASNSSQHDEINNKIDKIGNSVKWIEGYMKAQQELNNK